MKTRFALIVMLLSLTFLYAQESVDETTLKINNSDNTTEVTDQNQAVDTGNLLGASDYLVVILVLVGVVAALYFVLRFLRKVGGSRIGIDNDLIHVISTRALKGTTALHLVEVGNQIFLIGATDHSVNAISEITDQESKDMIALNLSVDNEENKSFFQHLSDKLQKSEAVESQNLTEAVTDVKTQKEKLNRF